MVKETTDKELKKRNLFDDFIEIQKELLLVSDDVASLEVIDNVAAAQRIKSRMKNMSKMCKDFGDKAYKVKAAILRNRGAQPR